MTLPAWGCPIEPSSKERVLLAHGEGGSLTRRLLAEHILPRLGRSGPLTDAAVLPQLPAQPVFTTDAFVVTPLFFPGGDIGKLAVYGTVNDLAVQGARPLWLSLALIIEEGFPLSLLDAVLDSVAAAANDCQVQVVAGDTKVVPQGKADGLFVIASGIGALQELSPIGANSLLPGDCLLVSGPIGQHGVAVLAVREDMGFDPPPRSDCAPLLRAVACLRNAGIRPRALRDATRGGVAAVLHEWAADCGYTLTIEEKRVPLSPEVRGVCELLGLDPLSIANEGTLVAAVAAEAVESTLEAWHSAGYPQAAYVGSVRPRGVVPVTVRRLLGPEQPLVEPSGSPLPRIC